MKRFSFPADGDIVADIRDRYGFEGDLVDIYASNTGTTVQKWHHYLPIYDRYFGRFRGTPVRFLEIGVKKGGSLQMWRRYLGDEAQIFGIDIDPDCAQYDGQAGQVRIGSQTDEAFLESVAQEMGGIDIVLDDGSHKMRHVRKSLAALYPHLTMGGVYMIEDMHTAYFPGFGGGLDDKMNFFNAVRNLIDDMHGWYHRGRLHSKPVAGEISGIHIHDSVVVLEKAPRQRPTQSKVG